MLAFAVTVGAGCGPPRRLAVEPDVTFAAHLEHEGVVFDRLAGDESAVVRPRSILRSPGTASYVLERAGRPAAALWLISTATVDARVADSSSAPVVASVMPQWSNGALRLTLAPTGATALQTDEFARVPPGGPSEALTRTLPSIIDLRGTYRAVVRDGSGAPVGWLRLRLGPYLEAPRLYDGVLPAAVGPELVAATTVALSSEVDWIEWHTLDVYRGSGDGPRGLSVSPGK